MKFSLKDRWAVVTGASAGIGAALAEVLAAQGCHLYLVARRIEQLEQLAASLKSRHQIKAIPITMDLALPGAAAKLKAQLLEPVSVVVNNAGLGGSGPFEQQSNERISQMLDLNVRFLTEFCQVMIQELRKTNQPARILNVGSIAGYQGVHNLMPYAATKAFVNNFSEGLNWELHRTPIKVTCLQPGSTASEFFEVAGMQGSFMATWGVMSSEAVATAGIKAMVQGKASIIPGFMNKVKVFSLRLTPRWLVRESIKWMFADLG